MAPSGWKWSAQNLTIVYTALAGVFALTSWRFMLNEWVYWPTISMSVILLCVGLYYAAKDTKESFVKNREIEAEKVSAERALIEQLTGALELIQGRDWRLLDGDEFDQEVKRRALAAIQAGKSHIG